MELSKAPRPTPFTAWGWGESCAGASVPTGGGGAAGGGGGGGGSGGNADGPVRKAGKSRHPPSYHPHTAVLRPGVGGEL